MTTQKIILKKGKEIPFLEKHPWVFSGAIMKTDVTVKDGDEVAVLSYENKFIAYGLYNSKSQINVRLYSWDESVNVDEVFFVKKIGEAVEFRKSILGNFDDDAATRLVYSEGDGLSGFVVDKYGKYLVIQITSLAIAMRIGIIVKVLIDLCDPYGIMLRTDKGVLDAEGLVLEDSLIWGTLPDNEIIIEENGIKFTVDPGQGQKTGFYIDQRANRHAIRKFAHGKKILDVCCYSGGFSLNALHAGAKDVTGVDVSSSACALYEKNMALNGHTNFSIHKSDAFKFLEKTKEENTKYEILILDPPKFSHSKSSMKTALKGYVELNKLAMYCLKKNGILVTCSCSGRISRNDFIFALHKAALETGKTVQILEIRGQAEDHPVSIFCPESEYLKCVICRVI